MKISFAFFISALCAVLGSVSAQDDPTRQVFRHPLTDMPPPAEDVETVAHFPKFEEKRFPTGEHVTVLCHFRNEGASMYNISAIMGSLNHPSQFSHHYQNYSYKHFGTVVRPGEEISLKYSFQPHPELEPADYQLAITVFYDSEVESFSSTFFNETIGLFERDVDVDFETIVSLLYAAVVMFSAGIVSFVLMMPDARFTHWVLSFVKTAASKAKAASEETPRRKHTSQTDDEEDDEDDTWELVQSRKQKRQRAKQEQAHDEE